MTSPSVDQFLHLMRTHAGPRPEIATGPDSLLTRLQVAYEALLPYAPDSVHPIAPPWPEPALAFEVRWRDGRTLTAATQHLPSGQLDSQLTLMEQGTTKTSVRTAHRRIAAAVITCLGPAPEV